jgi:L-alanine-DL-glutamate epimerase-like enolase superfamily enzyme
MAGEERQMSGVVSRKDFLRLGGAGLAGAVLMGIAGCGGSREAVRFRDLLERPYSRTSDNIPSLR